MKLLKAFLVVDFRAQRPGAGRMSQGRGWGSAPAIASRGRDAPGLPTSEQRHDKAVTPRRPDYSLLPLEHFPEKACPGRDPGWAPVFRRKCDKNKNLERFPIQLNRKAL
jgi:hypothetical protein